MNKQNKATNTVERGFYKPKSYRLSDENHKVLKELARDFGSFNLLMNHLIKLHNKKQ